MVNIVDIIHLFTQSNIEIFNYLECKISTTKRKPYLRKFLSQKLLAYKQQA